MTIVNTATGEILGEVTYANVRDSIDSAKASLEAAAEQIVWQVENRVWTVLGYADWNEMREAEYGGAAFMVPREDRPELVTRMRRAGLTQVEIAETAGVSEGTVRNDLNRNSAIEDELAPAIVNSRGQARPSSYTTTPKPERRDPAQLAETAVRDFPELAYYRDLGDLNSCIAIAHDLRTFAEPELTARRSILKRSIEVDQDDRRGVTRPVATEAPEPPKTCPTCGQTVRD